MRRVNIVSPAPTGWSLRSEPYDSDSLPVVLPHINSLNPHAQILVLPEPFSFGPPQLAVFDVDSTLINEEVIDLLAEAAGVGKEISEVTERAMAGELDFQQSLHARVAHLAGLPETVLDEVGQSITLTDGVAGFIDELHDVGASVAAVSGGFSQVLAPLAAKLELDFAVANTLEITDGKLTGKVTGDIVDAGYKAATLLLLTRQTGADPDYTLAVGDGANDIGMIQAAGCGVAFCAKPALKERADASLDIRDMGILQAIFTTPFVGSRFDLS